MAGRLGIGPDPTEGPGVNVGSVPVLSGAARGPLAALHLLGMLNEGANKVANAGSGELTLLAALAQHQAAQHGLVDPNNTATQAANAALAQGPMHPGRAIEAVRQGPDSTDAWLAGGLELASNPLNYTGPIGEAGKGIAVGLPLLGKVIQGVGRVGHVTNEAPFLPIRAGLALKRGEPVGEAMLRALLGHTAPVQDAGAAVQKVLGDMPLGKPVGEAGYADVGTVPTRQDFAQAARKAGLPIGQQVPVESSPLAPLHAPDLLKLAREGSGVVETKRLGLPLIPEHVDLSVAQREQGLPRFTGMVNPDNQLGDLNALVPDKTPRLVALAKLLGKPGEQAPLREALPGLAPPETPPVALPTPTSPLSASTGTQSAFDRILATADDGKMAGELPAGTAFWERRLGVGPDEARALLDSAVADGRLGRLDDGALMLKPSTPAATPGIDPRLTAALRDTGGIPADAITPAEEAAAQAQFEHVPGDSLPQTAMPDFPSYTDRASGLASLAPDEIDTLVNVAYPTTEAQGNAIAKYRDPAALASRALDRIQTGRGLAARLHTVDPVLARKVALLPDPVEAVSNVDIAPAAGPWDQSLQQLLKEGAESAAHLPSPKTPVEAGRTYYHVVPESYQSGDPVLAATELKKLRGIDVQDKWGDDYPNYLKSPDAKQVALTGTYAEAVDYLHSFLDGKGRILAVDVPQGAKLARNGEGYAVVNKQIPAGWVREVPLPQELRPAPTARVSAITPRPLGGDIAAGGGGGGMAVRGVGTVGGGAAGYVIGGTQGDTPEERQANALKGAGIGASLGLGGEALAPHLAPLAQQTFATVSRVAKGTMLSPEMHAMGLRAGERMQTESVASKGAQGVGNTLRGLAGAWRAQAVNTLKQLPQDAVTRWATLWGIARKELGVQDADIRFYQDLIARERDTGVTNLQNPVTDTLRQVGLTRLLDPKVFSETYGTDFLTSEAARSTTKLNAKQSSLAGAFFSGATPLPRVNPISITAGAIKGRFQPFINGYIQFLNGVQHDAFRYAMAAKTLLRDLPPLMTAFADDLERRGADVTTLRAKGLYSGADVAQLAGPQLGKAWDTLLEETVRNGGDRVAFLAGDFRQQSMYKGEESLGRVLPFIRWPLHYGPVFAEIAVNHPRLATVAAGLLVQQKEQAQQAGLKGYETATTPITTETPVLGGLARLRLGGQSGTVRGGLVGMVMPYSQALGGVDMPQGDNVTGYQKAKALLGAAGMAPNPLIQSAAYVTGQDYAAPGALSRTAGLEGAARLLPGGLGQAAVPSLGGGLDLARRIVEPLISKAGGVTTGPTSEYDPVMRRYAELVQHTTGKKLTDTTNRPYLLMDTPQSQALYAQAKQEVVLAGVAGNLTSMTMPASVTARGADAQGVLDAKRGLYTAAQMAASSPGVAAKMQAYNAAQQQTNPVLGTYSGASGSAREAMLLKDYQNRTAVLRKYKSAAAQRQLDDQYRKSLPPGPR